MSISVTLQLIPAGRAYSDVHAQHGRKSWDFWSSPSWKSFSGQEIGKKVGFRHERSVLDKRFFLLQFKIYHKMMSRLIKIPVATKEETEESMK